MIINDILEQSAKKHSSRTFIYYKGESYTYEETLEKVNKLAGVLVDKGVRKGEPVGLLFFRQPELVISFLAITKAGGIACPLNFQMEPVIFQKFVKQEGIMKYLLDKRFWKLVSGIDHDLVILTEKVDGKTFATFEECYSYNNPLDIQVTKSENDPVYFNYTSGSTGLPKGAITTHKNLEWNTHAAIEALELKNEDVHMCLFASYAHPHEIFFRAMMLGGSFVLLEHIYPRSIARAITEHNVTCVMGLPPMYESLIPFSTHPDYDYSSLRLLESGGMVTEKILQDRFGEKFQRKILPVWGSTETTGIAIAQRFEHVMPHDSVGFSCPYYEVKILDENNNELPPHQAGEMVISGPAVVQAYHNNPSETSRHFRNGWFYTEDICKKDELGRIYFLGRRSGMMKVAGLKVFPREIETVFKNHPMVTDAVVVSEPDRVRGEVPKAVITLSRGARVTSTEIKKFLRQHLANHKVPKTIDIVDVIPRTPSGKPDIVSISDMSNWDDNVRICNQKIDMINLEILTLLNNRAELAKKLRNMQGSSSSKLVSPEHVEEAIRRILGFNAGPILDQNIEDIFRMIISKDIFL